MKARFSFGWLAAILLVVLIGGEASADPGCCAPSDLNCLTPYQGNRVALVFGVNKYSGSQTAFDDRLNDLVNAGRDATVVAGLLSSQHFSIRCLLDPNINQFADELAILKSHLDTLPVAGDELDSNTVIVHFSGHGFRVEMADYIFLSGDYPKEEFKNNVMRIDELLKYFSGFGNLTIDFVIDACRNVSMQMPNWMSGQFFAATDYNAKKNTAHGLIFSTSQSRLALDASADIGAIENGAFVFVAKKYLNLPFVDLDLAYQLVRDDPDMRRINQTPDINSAAHDFLVPLAGPNFGCGYASMAVKQFGACSRAPAIGPTCKMACTSFNRYLVAEAQQPFCPRTMIDKIFPATQTCAPPEGNVAKIIGTIPVATPITAGDLASLRKEAQLVSAQTKAASVPVNRVQPDRQPASLPKKTVRDLVDQVQDPSYGIAPNGLTTARVLDIRSQILRASRESAGSLGSFSELAGSSLRAPGGPIELQLVPGAVGGTTGEIRPTGASKIDCVTQYCDPNWVMVRVPTANGIIDGWIDSKKVLPASAAESAQLAFVEDGTRLSRGSISDLQRIAELAKREPKRFLKITGVTRPIDDERIKAGQRTILTQSLLERRAVDPGRLTVRIVELQDTGGYAPVTVELLN